MTAGIYTTLTIEAIRQAAGITRPALPPGFDPAASFDTWGNRIAADGSRMAGPLADDEGCQRALAAAGVVLVPPVAGSGKAPA